MEVLAILSKQLTVFYLFLTMFVCINGMGLRRGRTTCNTHAMSQINIESEHGVKIEPLNFSRVSIDSLLEPFEDGHSLRFEFKSKSNNGSLFYLSRRHHSFDMVSGGLHNGYIHFKIRCSTSYADLTIPRIKVNDGEWHKVKFQRKHRKGVFMLDDKVYFEDYYVGCRGFNSVNFGSTNPDHGKSRSVQELQVQDGQFSGCIRLAHVTTRISASPHYNTVSECN